MNNSYNPSSHKTNNTNNPSTGLEEYGLIHKLALYSTLIFIFLIPWGDGLWDGLARVFGILSFSLATWLLVMEGTHKNYSYYHFFVIALWTWIVFSIVWTPNLAEGLNFTSRALQIMLLPFLFTIVIDNRKGMLMAYQSYILGNLVASGIILYNYLNGIQSPYYNRYTVKNIETDSMSILLALAIPMAAYLAANHDKKWIRRFNTIAIPMIIFAIFLTGTRTGSIVAIIGVLYWLFTHRKASFKIKVSIVTVFLLSIITIASFAPKASVDRVFSAGKSLKSGDLNYRTVVWKASLKEWKKSPILGVGLGGLGYVLNKNHVNFKEAHNTYIHLLTENGIIGLTLYLLLIMSIIYYILKTPFEEKVFLISLLMVTLVSQLTLHLQIGKETWFTYTMLVIHAIYSVKHKNLKISNK